MGQQSAASGEVEESCSPKTNSQRTHIRFTTSKMIDSLRPTVKPSTSIFKPPASPRGNAANRRLSQTRSNLTFSQQQFQQQRSRRTSQILNSSSLPQQTSGPFRQDSSQEPNQNEEEKESRRSSSTSTSGRKSGWRSSPGQAERSTAPLLSGSLKQDNTPTEGSLEPIPPQLVAQEWPTRTHNTSGDEDGSGEDEEESPSQAVTTKPSPQTATRYYTQSLSPSPHRSPSQPAAQPSQSDEVDTHIASADLQQHQPSSADSLGLSQPVCGQRMPTFSPTPNTRPSSQTQPYDNFDEVEYQEDLPEYFDDVDNIGRKTVAEDSLAGTSGESLSWSVTPQRRIDVDSVEVKHEVHHTDQEDIIPSTILSPMSKSPSQPEAEEDPEPESEPVEEELFERRTESISSEDESESHDDTNIRKQQPSSSSSSSHKSVTSRHNIFKTSHDIAKTRGMKTYGKQGRGRGRPPIPDHVKRQLDKDTLDLVSRTPSIQQVFLCIEIPNVPEITGSKGKDVMRAKTKAPRPAPGTGRKRVAEGSSRREPKSPSLQPPPPQKTTQQPAGQKRKQTNIQRRSSRRSRPHHPGAYYEKGISDYDDDDDEEEDEHKSEDKSGSDELEVIEVSPSINPRPIRTHLLPPKKRIRAHVSFEKDSLPPSPEEQHRPGPRILHDSDSDEGQEPRNVRRRRNIGVRLSYTDTPPPAQEQEQEYEQEQDQDQSVQWSPSPPPLRSSQENETGRRLADDAERRDDEEQEQGPAPPWEVAKLQKVWKEHGIRWPLRRSEGQEEYNTYFVFGSALPLPK